MKIRILSHCFPSLIEAGMTTGLGIASFIRISIITKAIFPYCINTITSTANENHLSHIQFWDSNITYNGKDDTVGSKCEKY